MKKRIFNFSAGPAVLPEEILGQVTEACYSYKETGIGIMEMSHRSAAFTEVIEGAKSNLKKLLNIGEEFEVLFLGGGASMQFHMLPLNFSNGKLSSYINTGAWSKKAITEAKRLGNVNIIASSEDKNFSYIPDITDEMTDKESSYLHFTSNNTIFGTQFQNEPLSNKVDLVCDASSDFLSRKIDINRYGMIYAGAQKNLGPAGVTVVLIRKDFLGQAQDELPPMLSYKNHVKSKSLFNTPPAFPIFVVGEVLKWILAKGGVEAMQKLNEEKASLLYDFISNSDFYSTTADPESKSNMNITFRLPKEDQEKEFIETALREGFSGLKGHRSVGGIRASIYNAFPKKGIEGLVSFMEKFEKEQG